MIAAGKTFRIAALPMAFKPKGSKKGTLVHEAGAYIGRPLYVSMACVPVVVVVVGLGMPGGPGQLVSHPCLGSRGCVAGFVHGVVICCVCCGCGCVIL